MKPLSKKNKKSEDFKTFKLVLSTQMAKTKPLQARDFTIISYF